MPEAPAPKSTAAILGFVVGGLLTGGLVALPLLLPPDGREHAELVQFLGRLHPILVHLPIALLVLVPLLELAALRRTWVHLRPGAGLLLWLATGSAILAALAGWMHAYGGGFTGPLVVRHLWGGVAVAVLGVAALLARGRAARSWYPVFLSGAFGAMVWTSHQGASITHGEDFLTEHAPAVVKNWLGVPAQSPVPAPPASRPVALASTAAAVTFAEVAPILEERCVTCHREGKHKGDLRLDTFALLMQGGKGGPAIHPGDPAGSDLVRRIKLSPDHDEFMPSGKRPLDPEQIALIEHWIAGGARPGADLPAVAAAPPPPVAPPAPARAVVAGAHPVNFSREILPVLSDNCFYCHGPDAGHRKADLRLDLEDAAHDVIVPGHSAKSELIARITTADEDDLMPPPASHKTLTPEQIELIRRWIDEGAPWGEHWAFAKLERPAVPPFAHPATPIRNPIDAFVLQRLQREGLPPSPAADRVTLIRRLTLDLTGLPPTPDEVRTFVADASPDAYERLVDRLLASPAYGERMAWDWMEVSRYADSNGYQFDAERTMWPWRDWVVKAFNENLPFDQFTRWQLAGDLLPHPTVEQRLATGFLRNHPINGEAGRIAEENRVDYVLDMTETTATTWMALTFTCSRCHDHKFDPITRKDYYGLYAAFNQTPVTGVGGNPQMAPVLDLSPPEDQARLAELEAAYRTDAARVEAIEAKLFPCLPGQKLSESPALAHTVKFIRDIIDTPALERENGRFDDLVLEFEGKYPEYIEAIRQVRKSEKIRSDFAQTLPRVMVMADDPEHPRKTHILEKGIYNQYGAEVQFATMAKLPPLAAGEPRNRLGIADWLVAPENPLTPRVIVNRYWQMLFGYGLVKTAEDFGTKGELPVHPELLDWLACEFRDGGWNTKALLRTIVLSATYRQTSRVTPELHDRDPDNRLLARGSRYRLPAWMIRDQALAASGLLVERVGGPPVKPYQPAGIWEETSLGKKHYEQEHGEALHRRSLYTFWRRIIGPTEFFDTASRMTCVVKPTRTNTPLHALSTLNNTTYVEAARQLAQEVLLSAGPTPEARAAAAFERVLCRPPQPGELAPLVTAAARAGRQFAADPAGAVAFVSIGETPRDSALPAVEHAAWTAVCLAILNLDETLSHE